MLGLQRVAVGGIDGRPPKLDASSRRRDIAARCVKDAIVGACEGPFGGCGGPVADELLHLQAEVRERFLEHPEKAEDLVTTTRLSTRRHHLSIGGPWVSVAVAVVDGRDVLEDYVSGVGHQLSKLSLKSPPSQKRDSRCGRIATLRLRRCRGCPLAWSPAVLAERASR